jgi:hypothetical protein
MSAADRRDELRARRAERASERAAFEERRRYGVQARHAAKLAYLAARKKNEEVKPEDADNPTRPEPPTEPEAA